MTHQLSSGMRFGHLVFVSRASRASKRGHRIYGLFECRCGQKHTAVISSVIKGRTKSCGCAKGEMIGAALRTHGKPPEYSAWVNMKTRCLNPNYALFAEYGGRGISVCAAWVDSFETFRADMGPRPSSQHYLDRVDPNGNYEPENCRWAELLTHARNKRCVRQIAIDGRTLTIPEWSAISGVRRKTIWRRLKLDGWDPVDAVFLPSMPRVAYADREAAKIQRTAQ